MSLLLFETDVGDKASSEVKYKKNNVTQLWLWHFYQAISEDTVHVLSVALYDSQHFHKVCIVKNNSEIYHCPDLYQFNQVQSQKNDKRTAQ